MNRPPVTDWATDFDHLDSEFVKDPHTIYSQLRDECPVAHTDRYHGVWIPTRYEDLAAIAHDHQRFSSRTILVTDRAESPTDLGFHAPPITEDPPYHTDIRRLLLPVFSPAVVAAYEPITETMANDLIDGFIERGECDAAADYAQHVPIKVITRMLGIPDSDHARFRDWIHRLIEESPLAGDTTFDAIFEIGGYLAGHVDDHRETPARRHHHPPPRRPHARRPRPRRPRDPRRVHPAAPRRHRHHLVRDRIVAPPPRHPPRRPTPPHRRARPDPLRHRGVPAGLRTRHHGTRGHRGHRHRRLPHAHEATGSCSRSRPATATPTPSTNPTRSSSTARSTGTSPSGSASTAAWGPTSPAWSCGSPSRPGSIGSPSSRSPTPTPSPGLPARSAVPAPCPSPFPPVGTAREARRHDRRAATALDAAPRPARQRRGLAGLVITEAGRTAYLSCAAAALAVDIDILTGVAVAFPRSPMVTAQTAWELADVSDGRFRLGLGTQVRAHIERRYSSTFDPPGPRMRDYLLAVRACFEAFRTGSAARPPRPLLRLSPPTRHVVTRPHRRTRPAHRPRRSQPLDAARSPASTPTASTSTHSTPPPTCADTVATRAHRRRRDLRTHPRRPRDHRPCVPRRRRHPRRAGPMA